MRPPADWRTLDGLEAWRWIERVRTSTPKGAPSNCSRCLCAPAAHEMRCCDADSSVPAAVLCRMTFIWQASGIASFGPFPRMGDRTSVGWPPPKIAGACQWWTTARSGAQTIALYRVQSSVEQSVNGCDQEVLTWRVNILSMALAELAEALPSQEAARASRAIRAHVAGLIGEGQIPGVAVDSVAADLGPLLSALTPRGA